MITIDHQQAAIDAGAEVECAPEWDGHTPQVAAQRLRQMLEGDV